MFCLTCLQVIDLLQMMKIKLTYLNRCEDKVKIFQILMTTKLYLMNIL